MKITTKLLKYPYTIEGETQIFLMIIFLHFNGKISREKLFGVFKSLKTGNFIRYINSHKNSINKKWYNGESTFEIMKDVFYGFKLDQQEMTFDMFLQYLNMFLNKGKGDCIDYFKEHFVDVAVDSIGYDYENNMPIEYLKTLEVIPIHIESYHNFKPFGYCCEDCDGDYESYKRSQYEYKFIDDLKKMIEERFTRGFYKKRK